MKRARLNQRRYSAVVKLLKGVISDEKQPLDKRIRAADRLIDVYDRNDRLADRLARREAVRTDTQDEPGTPTTDVQGAAPELSAEQEAELFLERMRSRHAN